MARLPSESAVPTRPPPPSEQDRHLVLVTGPGRSGTSAITGALGELGLKVPGPLVAANRTNPRGFYENRWVVDFQRDLLARAGTYEFDGDPAAPARVQAAVRAEDRAALAGWVDAATARGRQFVVKDPRTTWLQPIWDDVLADAGIRTSSLTMLRHPAEVVASRTRSYAKARSGAEARAYAISKIAGWINVSLLNERLTRSNNRAFVKYDELVRDWRAVLHTVERELGLTFDTDVGTRRGPHRRHPVDAFIASDLHRVHTTWEDLDVPATLRALAQRVWDASEVLASGVDDVGTSAAFDRLAEDYRRLYADAAAVTTDRRAALAPLAASSVDTADEEEVPPPATAPRWVGRLAAVLRRSRRVPPGAGESGSVPHVTTTADSRDH